MSVSIHCLEYNISNSLTWNPQLLDCYSVCISILLQKHFCCETILYLIYQLVFYLNFAWIMIHWKHSFCAYCRCAQVQIPRQTFCTNVCQCARFELQCSSARVSYKITSMIEYIRYQNNTFSRNMVQSVKYSHGKKLKVLIYWRLRLTSKKMVFCAKNAYLTKNWTS